MDTIQKVITALGASVALIYAIGRLAQVMNLWGVEKAHDFSFLTAWQVVSLMDREYVIGLGVKYLGFSLILAFIGTLVVIPVLSWRSRKASEHHKQDKSDKLKRASKELEIRSFTPPLIGTISPESQKTWFEKYLWLLLSSIFIALVIVIVFLPVRAYAEQQWLPWEPNSVVEHLPQVEMSIANTAGDSAPDTEGEGQTGQAQASNEVTGVLLSHDSEYWYILSLGEDEDVAELSVVPVDGANNVRITP